MALSTHYLYSFMGYKTILDNSKEVGADPAEEFIKVAFKEQIRTHRQLQELKNKFCLRYKRSPFANVELIKAYRNLIKKGEVVEDKELWNILRKRGVRSQSGIASVTVITKPYACPGTCIFCPSEPNMPKSYLSNEPAIMRAILNDFDSYNQTMNRLSGLQKSGHHTDKIDVIVSGGTFSFYPREYQNEFTKGIYDALNSPLEKGANLKESQEINETAQNRCIGLSYETRPDHINEEELINLRKLGCTKIEIGVQSLNDKILTLNKRGHGVRETAKAMQLMRDAGFKINCHMMPNLYGSDLENDFSDFRELFDNPAYRPDWLKIYPCMVVPWSELESHFSDGRYIPYTDDQLMKLLIRIKQIVPEYIRITRLYRDIPAPTIIGGSKISNLRQFVQQKMEADGLTCRCIRCREIKGEKVYPDKVTMKVIDYEASEGKEFFITCNDAERDKLCSLLRLRFSSYSLKGKNHFIKELDGASIVREIHTYGEQVRVEHNGIGESQHIGLGKRMMMKAEEISRDAGYKKIAVISGIGVREYYRKLGYALEGTYMVKDL